MLTVNSAFSQKRDILFQFLFQFTDSGALQRLAVTVDEHPPEKLPQCIRQVAHRFRPAHREADLRPRIERTFPRLQVGRRIASSAVGEGMQSAQQNHVDDHRQAEPDLFRRASAFKILLVQQKFRRGELRHEVLRQIIFSILPRNLETVAVDELNSSMPIHQEVVRIEVVDQHSLPRKQLHAVDQIQRNLRKLEFIPAGEEPFHLKRRVQRPQRPSGTLPHGKPGDEPVPVEYRHQRPREKRRVAALLQLQHRLNLPAGDRIGFAEFDQDPIVRPEPVNDTASSLRDLFIHAELQRISLSVVDGDRSRRLRCGESQPAAPRLRGATGRPQPRQQLLERPEGSVTDHFASNPSFSPRVPRRETPAAKPPRRGSYPTRSRPSPPCRHRR